jgi:hypothetical protein
MVLLDSIAQREEMALVFGLQVFAKLSQLSSLSKLFDNQLTNLIHSLILTQHLANKKNLLLLL